MQDGFPFPYLLKTLSLAVALRYALPGLQLFPWARPCLIKVSSLPKDPCLLEHESTQRSSSAL